MQKKFILILLPLIASVVFSPAFAGDETPRTPYGDYCPKCSKYGMCRKLLSVEDSREAIKGYFDEKGLDIGTMKVRGRFIQIKVLKNGETSDVILFDRKSGRIRSIY